ncbi:MAG: hypothetical protein QY309_13260 [Cyclobacteriaceae bacterium]|nr:MAG: hypothetical protein QY309_13260 [Cyclobacteriaceae bacterium]
MRLKTIVLAIIFIIQLSCNSDSKRQQEKAEQRRAFTQDSLKRVNEERQRKIKDSLILIEQDKVIGDVKFTMTKKVAKNEILKFKKSIERKPPGSTYMSYYYIGEYESFQILDFYHEDKLYYLLIQGTPILWEKYDFEVPNQVKFISDVIEQKYGKPTISNEVEPRHKLQSGYSYLIKQWDVGRKRIKISIDNNTTSYMVNLTIYQPDIESKINSERLRKEQESTKKAKDLI